MSSEDRELLRQVWSVVSEPVEETKRLIEENGQPEEISREESSPSRDFSDTEAVIISLTESIADGREEFEAGGDGRLRFDPKQLTEGRLGFQYRDQIKKLYGDVLAAMPSLQPDKAEKEFAAIVQAEKNRIRKYGRKIATLLKTSIDIEKEKIRINTWIEGEYAAGRCQLHRFYQMSKRKQEQQTGKGDSESGKVL